MTEEAPPEYATWLIIMVVVAAIMISLIYVIYTSDQARSMLASVLYWIPGMTKVIMLFGGGLQ